MTNPLNGGGFATNGSFQGMVANETRTVSLARRSRSEVKYDPDPTSKVDKIITRTNRTFAEDWVDSSNKELMDRGVRDMMWAFPGGPDLPPQLMSVKMIRQHRERQVEFAERQRAAGR